MWWARLPRPYDNVLQVCGWGGDSSGSSAIIGMIAGWRCCCVGCAVYCGSSFVEDCSAFAGGVCDTPVRGGSLVVLRFTFYVSSFIFMLSIIIIAYNSAAQLGACLRAVSELRAPPEFEVIVVDNASGDASAAIAAGFPGVQVVTEERNWGFAGGVNRGVRAAQGEIIALLNPDALPQPDWLVELVAPLADARIGVVGSKVLAPDGRIQSVGSILQQPVLLSAHRGDGERDTGQYDEIADVWSVHGAAMAFRREVWDKLEGLSEDYFPAYWEESDFCERARGRGYRVVVAPRAVVRHAEATTTGKYSPEFYYYYHRNRLTYLSDHFDWRYLWDKFRLAEHARLASAPLLDRRIARLVYTHGVPPLVPLDDDRRAAILATGRA
ncbi:MAG: glycosyltransferase family 2 protein, partial [Blastochloris sp.]|nr:glycosyltransferase family 2 protein [Blastochloris sp.]